MNSDNITNIFQHCDSHTKIPFSITCRWVHSMSRNYIQEFNVAVESRDIFSIVNADWTSLSDFKIGLLGSTYLLAAYERKTRIDKWQVFVGACEVGSTDIARDMISRGVTDLVDGFIYACRNGRLDTVNLLIECGANFWNYGLTSAAHSNINIVKIMIEHGADNWTDGLISACISGQVEIAKLLISKGADPKIGMAFICSSGSSDNHTEICKLLIEAGANVENNLIYACHCGNLNIAKCIVDCGATNLNDALASACRSGHHDICKFLISRGVTQACH